MSKTLKSQSVSDERLIDYKGIPGVTAFVKFDPDNITKGLVEYYIEEAGLDKDTFDVDAAVKEWREVIESGYGLAVHKGKAIALELVPVGPNRHTPVVRDVKNGRSAFEMNLIGRPYSPDVFRCPTAIVVIYVMYVQQKAAA